MQALTGYDYGMRIVTLNCNGVRSAATKGIFDWLAAQAADVARLQETKAQEQAALVMDFDI